MPRTSLGPRLWFDEGRQNWVIRDGSKFIRTGKAGWQEAQAALNKYVEGRPVKQPLAKPATGFVYFLTAEYPGFPIKIGFTQKPHSMRSKGLQTACPYPLFVLGMIAGGYSDERRLHRQFAAQRLQGEWFARSPELMDLINALK